MKKEIKIKLEDLPEKSVKLAQNQIAKLYGGCNVHKGMDASLLRQG